MDWLHQAQTARQNHARRSQMKKLLVLSGFLDQKFAGNLKEVGQIVPDSVRILLCLQKETECGVVWLNLASFLQILGPGNQIEPAIFCLAPSGMFLSDCLGLGVARA